MRFGEISLVSLAGCKASSEGHWLASEPLACDVARENALAVAPVT